MASACAPIGGGCRGKRIRNQPRFDRFIDCGGPCFRANSFIVARAPCFSTAPIHSVRASTRSRIISVPSRRSSRRSAASPAAAAPPPQRQRAPSSAIRFPSVLSDMIERFRERGEAAGDQASRLGNRALKLGAGYGSDALKLGAGYGSDALARVERPSRRPPAGHDRRRLGHRHFDWRCGFGQRQSARVNFRSDRPTSKLSSVRTALSDSVKSCTLRVSRMRVQHEVVHR